MAIHRVRYRCSIWPGYSSSRTSATAQTYFGVGRSARVQTYDSSCPSLFFSLLRRGDMKTNKKVVIRITSFRAPATLWNKKKKPKRGVRPAHFSSPLSNIILHVTTTFAIFTLCPPPWRRNGRSYDGVKRKLLLEQSLLTSRQTRKTLKCFGPPWVVCPAKGNSTSNTSKQKLVSSSFPGRIPHRWGSSRQYRTAGRSDRSPFAHISGRRLPRNTVASDINSYYKFVNLHIWSSHTVQWSCEWRFDIFFVCCRFTWKHTDQPVP